MKKTERYVLGSAFSGWFFLIIVICCILIPFDPAVREDVVPGREKYLFSCFHGLCAPILMVFALFYGKHYAITAKGIWNYLFGIPYRFTKWENVIDAAALYAGGRDNHMGLLITVKGGKVFHPEGKPDYYGRTCETIVDTYCASKELRLSMLRRKNFFMIITMGENGRKSFALFEKFYGKEIDYFPKYRPAQIDRNLEE